MATVYEIKIKGVSDWVNYDEKTIKKTLKKALSNLIIDDDRVNKTTLDIRKIEVERVA